MRRLALLLGVLSMAGIASAQTMKEDFNRPPSTNIPGWTESRGDWSLKNNAAEAESLASFQYLLSQVPWLRDLAVECRVEINASAPPGTQAGGITVRCSNPTYGKAGADLILAKLQDNSGGGKFDRAYLYEFSPSGSPSAASFGFTNGKSTGQLALIVKDARAVALFDQDDDGNYDKGVDMNLSLGAKPGPVGLHAFGPCRIDDFRLYDAVLVFHRRSPPAAPGNTIRIEMRGAPNEPFQAALAFSRDRGIPLGQGRAVPLDLDPGVYWSLAGIFGNFAGRLDANGDGELGVRIPPSNAVVGTRFVVAYVNFNQTGISRISNPWPEIIVPGP